MFKLRILLKPSLFSSFLGGDLGPFNVNRRLRALVSNAGRRRTEGATASVPGRLSDGFVDVDQTTNWFFCLTLTWLKAKSNTSDCVTAPCDGALAVTVDVVALVYPGEFVLTVAVLVPLVEAALAARVPVPETSITAPDETAGLLLMPLYLAFTFTAKLFEPVPPRLSVTDTVTILVPFVAYV